jgi:histidyl-tRNA synthetase
MAKIEPRTLKGFPDFGPLEQLARQEMFRKIQDVFERFGFLPLSTPTLEYKEILTGKYGDDEKLLYSFKDHGDRDVAMRYDLTVPMARYVAQNQGQLVYPFKRYQIAPVWRADNTQKGRLREFYQCDIDVVGTNSQVADAEVIACYVAVLQELGISNFRVRINDRQLFDMLAQTPEEARELPEVIRCIDKVDKIGVEGVNALLFERRVSEALRTRAVDLLGWGTGEGALDTIAALSDEAAARVAEWRALMDLVVAFGAPREKIVFDPTIARGLDYYTSTVFECVLTDIDGYGSIGGGGRYDGLLNTFSDKPLPAVGVSVGIDRLFEALQEQGLLTKVGGVDVLVLNMGPEYMPEYVRIATELRVAGVSTELYYEDAKLDKQFKYAESKGARLAIILGEEEKVRRIIKIKNLQTREQVEVEESELLAAVTSKG